MEEQSIKEGIGDKLVTGVQTCALPIYNGVLIHSHRNIRTVTNWGAGSNVNGAEGLLDRKSVV